jgi:hypothetical protein
MPVFSNNAGGGGGGPTPGTTFNNLPGAVAVGDAVYLLPAPNPPNTVARACAGASPLQTPDAIGVVVATPTPTTCVVVSDGLATISPPLPPLVQGATYYVSPLPAPAPALVPVAPSGSGMKIQEVGIAASPTQLYVYADPTSLIL